MLHSFLVVALLLASISGLARAATPTLAAPTAWARVATDLPPDIDIATVSTLPDERFASYDAARTSAPSIGNPVWLRLRLPPAGKNGHPAMLVPGHGSDNFVDLFLPEPQGSWRRVRGGEDTWPSEREWPGLQTAFLVQLPPAGEEVIAYLRIVQPYFTHWRLRLEPDVAGYVEAEQRRLALLLAYFGALGAIFAYNLFLYLRLRYRDLLYYLAYIGAFGFMMGLESSALWLVMPTGDPLRVSGILALFNLALAALLTFMREYHELPTRMPRTARVVTWVARGFVVAGGVYWLNVNEGFGLVLYNLNVAGILATLVAVFVIPLLAWRRGARQARFFVAAFGCYMLSMLAVIVSSEFVPFLSRFQESLVALAGSAAEFILLSFAIGERFRRIQLEKEALQASYTAQLERDVTARTSELARLNAEKDELMGVVAHDLRAPLGALRGTARLVRRSPTLVAPDDREAVEEIVSAADRMLLLANSLLDHHVIESGKLPVRIFTADVRDALTEAARRFRDTAAAKRQMLVVQTGAIPLPARHDAALLGQVLDNFVSNALKFSPAGTEIRLTASPHADAVRLAVHDAGPGLSEADLAKIFQPFVRLTAQPTGGESSTGLGLAAARKLTIAMDGRICVENAPTGGAVFWVELPTAT